MEDKLAYMGVKPHLKNLNFCGFYQLDPNSAKMKRILHTAFMRLIFFLILLYTGQQIIKVYQDRDDLNKVMDTMFLLLTNSDSIYKQIVLWKKANRIEILLNIMKGPIFNQKKPEHQEYLLATARQARLLLRVFNTVALSTCLLWVLYPVILYVQRKPVEFAIWLPFDANLSPQFYFVAFYVWVQTSWLAFSNTTMDVFITFFLTQCKTQLSILRLDLENIVQKSKEEALESRKDLNVVLERRFRIVLLHYDEIIKFSGVIQEVFSGAVLYQFLVSGWIICTTAYRTVNINPMSVEFVSMLMYMCCILTELFIFCFYGNEVTHESEKLIESVYALDWLEIPTEYRRAIIIFMERIKRSINLVAGDLIPLSNSTFVSVLRSSYTFYAFLKNTN
ncbi:odorant receptor 94a-like [Spodoptera litura]|uniref:Odorant receptor n=1 Tax=Spodoptera litura TaxID=69820 RepID=A0A9J7IUJ6_SPOLT|nr:odorant receptor 94a-like [Spodoptera litura]